MRQYAIPSQRVPAPQTGVLAYASPGLPATLSIDWHGRVRHSVVGPAMPGVLAGTLQSLLTSAASLVRILLTGGTLKHVPVEGDQHR